MSDYDTAPTKSSTTTVAPAVQAQPAPKTIPMTPSAGFTEHLDKIPGIGLTSASPAGAHGEKVATPVASRMAYPPSFDLGDQITGTRNDSSIFIMNTGNAPAHITYAFDRDPSIQLLRAPSRLQPSVQGFDPNSGFDVRFSPLGGGHVRAKLSVDVQFEDGSGVEHGEISIVGGSHHAAQPTLAEQEANAAREATETKEQHDRDAARQRVEQRIHADEAAGKTHHPGHYRALERERDLLWAAMFDLIQAREAGVIAASVEIGEFKRMHPAAENPSLLASYAMLALDIATAGIAGSLGKVIEATRKVDTVTEKAVAAFITDSVKESVKQGEKKLKEGGGREEVGAPRHDPKADFISQQLARVNDRTSNHEHAVASANATFDALLPVLDKTPEAAINSMQALRSAVHAEADLASNKQRTQTSLHWIRYVAATSTHGHELAVPPPEHGTPKAFDGLVDVRFRPGNDPTERVKRVSAEVHGVRGDLADRLRREPLLGLGVSVRAMAVHADMDATTPITVVRDASGAVTYIDQTGDGRSSHWLARHAGIAHGGENAQLAGARKLIEEEIMFTPLDKLLKSDSET